MHILIAPNAFKNSLSAASAAIAIQKGWLAAKPGDTCVCFPVGDGGDGTDILLTDHFHGQKVAVNVNDPLGRKINAAYGLINENTTAVIGIAAASGMGLLQKSELDPLNATSYGTGELMMDALTKGAQKFIIAMGGSATVDGGTGMLAAMGVRFLNADGEQLVTPESFVQLDSIDISKVDPRWINAEITILCDVDNRLLGATGAAATFGPQKGATPEAVEKLEASLSQLAVVINKQFDIDISQLKHGGAAGGAAATLAALFKATLADGATQFLALTGFAKSLSSAGLVITGEGSLDEQTLHGKAPFRVAVMAKEKNIAVIGMAGNIPEPAYKKLQAWFDQLVRINPPGIAHAAAISATAANLEATALRLAKESQ